MKQQLFTKENLKHLRPIGIGEDEVPMTLSTMVPVHFFHAIMPHHWFIWEKGDDGQLFGLCCITEPEYGETSVNELMEFDAAYRSKVALFGLGLERDLGWDHKRTLEDALNRLEQGGYDVSVQRSIVSQRCRYEDMDNNLGSVMPYQMDSA